MFKLVVFAKDYSGDVFGNHFYLNNLKEVLDYLNSFYDSFDGVIDRIYIINVGD